MSTASQFRFREPLTQLVQDFIDWVRILRRVGLRRRGGRPDDPDRDVRASDELERFREPAKAIIVWLELHGSDADAAVQKKRREWEAAFQALHAAREAKDEAGVRRQTEVIAVLRKPLTEIYEERLKPGLDRLPTRAPRSAAEQASPPAGSQPSAP
jgi:hypothetical protein